MAETGATQSQNTWPVPEFHFSVEITNVGVISCKEVSGLETEFDVIEYRAGDSPEFTKTKQPGLRKTSDITLKKGIFMSDTKVWDFIGLFSVRPSPSSYLMSLEILSKAGKL